MKEHTYKNPKLIENTIETSFLLETDVESGASPNQGSILGSTTLVAGTTVGAGILALPAVTLPAGILPSTLLLIGVWFYTLISALLIAELVLNSTQTEGATNVGFIGIVEIYLGKTGGKIAGIAYLFLHYALLVAYLAEGGEVLLEAISTLASRFNLPHTLPGWSGSTIFALIMGSILCIGRGKFVERVNSIFVGIVVASFIGLLIIAGEQVQISNFVYQNWQALPIAVPIMLVALFYHNIVPVVVTQLERDVKKIRKSIIIGSAIPLIMFLAWNAVILGSVDNISIDNVNPLELLRSGSNGSLLGILISIFSEFAIATSFIGFVYGLLDFFGDLHLFSFNKNTSNQNSRLSLISLALIPPTGLSLLNPDIFLTALDYAGTYSTSILGSILPALVSWKQREEYKLQQVSPKIGQTLVPGGKITLIVLILIASFIILRQFLLII